MADLSELQKLLDRAAHEMPNKVLRIIGVEGKNFIAKILEMRDLPTPVHKNGRSVKQKTNKGVILQGTEPAGEVRQGI